MAAVFFSSQVAAVFLTLIMIGTPAAIFSSLNKLDFLSSCDTVSYSLRYDYTRTESFDSQNISQCNDLSSGSIHSAISLLSSSDGCSYKLIAFSGSSCADDRKVKDFSLNFSDRSTVTLRGHERKPVCSYFLGNTPQHDSAVLVKFGGGNVETITHELNQKDCYSLCGSPDDWIFPQWAGVYNRDDTISQDNYIELFSEPYCMDGSQIRFENGRTNIKFEKFNEIEDDQAIGSFILERER